MGPSAVETWDEMQIRILAGAALLGALSLGGCATEDYVNKHVAVVQDQVTQGQAVQTQQGQHLDQLDQNTRDALSRAEEAHKLAQGKFLFSMVLSDDSVKFPLDSSRLSPEAETRLADFVTKLSTDNQNVYVEIQGHTDATGNDAINMRLGEARAEAVRLFMNRKGVPLNRMATISYGDTSPVAPNNTRNGRAQNRRVVLIVMA
jgi:outer membrane protein OmpA-like peptidoglycan-associated protein